MQIRIGYEMIFDCPQPTPMILTLNVHYSRVSDIIIPDHLITDPTVPISAYRDGFGNWCSRIVAPAGQIRLSTDALVKDTGQPDLVVPSARRHQWPNYPRRPCCSCWEAAIARPIGCRSSLENVRQRTDWLGARAGDL